MSRPDLDLKVSPDHANNHHVAPAAEPDGHAKRLAEWTESRQPGTAEQVWLVAQIVFESLRLDRLRKREPRLIAYFSRRASVFWDEDRRLAVETLADTIGKKPALVAVRLQQSRHGCDWLLDRWHALGRLLEANGEWTDAQKSLAFNLLGLPKDLRLGEPWERGRHDSPRALVEHEIERLEGRKSQSLDALDATERELAEEGLAVEPPRPLVQLIREDAACVRRLQWCDRQLRARPAQPRETEAPIPPPESRPEPLPMPSDADYIAFEQDMFSKLLAGRPDPQLVPGARVQPCDLPHVSASAAPAVNGSLAGKRRA